ncbi:MAG: hydantoinase/oxoprolinase family protein [Alphaproteobacteria bacterium]|nr:hydantoinase/oxoprolinase family protein [Alphaproteobacteria bacterium]
MIRVAFDIGGTFTDLVLQDGTRHRLVLHKTPTTPDDLSRGVMDGLTALLRDAAVAPGEVDAIFHATTIATNAILERKGALTGLITTAGFRDILLMGRQKRYDTQNMYMDKPVPLTRRRHIVEVAERTGFDGRILAPLDPASVDAAIDRLLKQGIESVAVALIHSYANPAHELQIAARLAARAPNLAVSLSSQVSPKYREYERTSTTVANAYVKPIVARYTADIEATLAARGFRHRMYIMQSNGGLVTPALAKEYPIRIVESGPAAGVLLCAAVGREEGFERVFTFDMGGTTAKLGAIDDGKPAITSSFEVDAKNFRKWSGLPLNVPAIELIEIGAGGGSIAATDGRLIAVGPESAGAQPGPICYGFGGTRPTITDANLVLGYLNPGYFNGGAMALDSDRAIAGVAAAIGTPLKLAPVEAAWGIHAVANSNMERAMRVISVERGRDPRKYAMVAFGGAGPLHAARLARALGIPTVIVPRGAGVGAAIGMLNADARLDTGVTRLLTLVPGTETVMAEVYADLEARLRADLAHLQGSDGVRWLRYAYMHYKGQGYEIKVDLPDGPIADGYARRAIAAFEATYEQSYGYKDPGAVIEAVDWNLVAVVPTAADGIAPLPPREGTATEPVVGERPAYFAEAGGVIRCKVVDRYRMRTDQAIAGPAIVEEAESTTVVLPGDSVRLSPRGNLVITIGEGR